MLVLSRKHLEDIIINDYITVRVLEIRGRRVKLGISAPPELSVHRGEIYDAIQGAKSNRLEDGAPYEWPSSIASCRPKKPGGMLVLYRHKNETIVIGDDIIITVVDIRADKVRLGIEAPIEISVHRREVYEAIRESREEGDAAE